MSVQTKHVAFPSLDDEQLAVLEPVMDVVDVPSGETLFRAGERDFDFFVVKRGSIGIYDESTSPSRQIVVHGPGEFTGDVDMLTGRPSPVSAKTEEDSVVYRICAEGLRRALAEVPTLSDLLLGAFQMRRGLLEEAGFAGIRVIGPSDSKETLEIREFLYKNKVPHAWTDSGTDEGRQTLQDLEADPEHLPVLSCHATGHVAHQPCLQKVADCIGIRRPLCEKTLYDVTIIGCGPAGLAAAVYGASEGLNTLVVDRMGPGGQAGTSSKIENYMGFPAGLPGAELANRAYLQALRFGAVFSAPEDVQTMECRSDDHLITLAGDRLVRTRCVIVASGASYRRLPIDNCEEYEGRGVYYSATSVEARLCRDATALVIGGGNSAGQAAMFLSETAREVKILIRGDDLGKSMSRYLCNRIEKTPNIEVMSHTEVKELSGEGSLRKVGLIDNRNDKRQEVECTAVFGFIGAKPHTEWLPDGVATDDHGFILTGGEAGRHERWPLEREPCVLETTCPGVFAAGDVRSGTTKRVAFAAGDGALAITCAHQFLSDLL